MKAITCFYFAALILNSPAFAKGLKNLKVPVKEASEKEDEKKTTEPKKDPSAVEIEAKKAVPETKGNQEAFVGITLGYNGVKGTKGDWSSGFSGVSNRQY